MLDWLIVGGGVHGTYLSNILRTHCYSQGKKQVALRILDPGCGLMARWERLTRNTGMEFLRSPRVHHVGIAPDSLHRFAIRNYANPNMQYTEPYYRPSLELFGRHSQWVIAQNKLNRLFIQGRATHLKRCRNGLSVSSTAGTIKTRRLLLCLGLTDQPLWPDWARTLQKNGGHIHHILEADTVFYSLPPLVKIAIVGGGMTGVQASLWYSQHGSRKVTNIRRHPLRISQFDADPGWIGPKYLSGFNKISDLNIRRKLIVNARNYGSVSMDMAEQLKRRTDLGLINSVQAKIKVCEKNEDSSIRIIFKERLKSITVNMILLATGFESKRPGGSFVDQMTGELDLPCARCGYPIVNQALQWYQGIFVSGSLAELKIGPVARNIAGARLAAKRITAAL